jgi:hypothetical protein
MNYFISATEEEEFIRERRDLETDSTMVTGFINITAKLF